MVFASLARETPSAFAAPRLHQPHPPPPLSLEELRGLHGKEVTLIGFGSLLSEQSSRTTFPTLHSFRLGRVQGFRRLFQHPAAIFYERGIARPEAKEVSSLSVEPVDDHSVGFVCSLFDVPAFDVEAYLNREEEFDFTLAHYQELESPEVTGRGLMCMASTDEQVETRWGQGYIESKYRVHGVDSIWRHGWGDEILPCGVYLRHCVLAAKKQGGDAYESFLAETYLADRRTTIKEYLAARPEILLLEPPPSVAGRYSG